MENNKEHESVKIPKGTLLALKGLAEERKTTVGEVIRQAVNTEAYMSKQLVKGFIILAQDPETEETWKVVFPHLQ